ncbi:CHASE2 domain-containing protein [Melittangium boletus]|uniref:CHASE2 domain-containing protein n=1 Tax=Melittangium boletus TaxID=83453 RepID=UPI0031842F5C
MRRTHFAYTDGQNPYVTLPVALAGDLFGASELVFSGQKLRLGSREFQVNPDGSAELDFGGTLHERFPILPVLTVLDAWALRQQGKPGGIDPELLRGKIVVVGALAPGVGDYKVTPFAAFTPGVSQQVTVLENLLSGRFITETPFWVSLLLALGLAVLSAVGLMTLRSPALEVAWLLGLVPGVFLGVGLSLEWAPWPPTTSSLAARPCSSARPSAGTWNPGSSSR